MPDPVARQGPVINQQDPVINQQDLNQQGPVTDTLDRTGIGMWLQRTLRAGDVVFDVGANVGGYSALAAAVVGDAGHVYAFEPGPDNLRVLRRRFDPTCSSASKAC